MKDSFASELVPFPSWRTLVDSLLQSKSWCRVMSALRLFPREREIVEIMIAIDFDEEVFAQQLGISPHTVHTHIERMYRKVKVTSRSELMTRLLVVYASARENQGPCESLRNSLLCRQEHRSSDGKFRR